MSYPSYLEYKDPGVRWLGEVPKHWTVAPLKSQTSYNDEVLSENTPGDLLVRYVEIADVDSTAGIMRSTEYPFAQAPSRARRIVRDGDVLISTVRTYLRAIAPVQNPPKNMVASTGFAVVRPSSDGLCGGFLGYLLRAEWLIAEIISRSVGVSYPAIGASELMGLKVPVPMPSEQTQIARFLDHQTARIDALIAEQQRLIELLKEKRQAVISHAVTKGLDPDVAMKDSGVEWLGEVPAHWEIKKLKHLTLKFEQGWSPQCENSPVQGSSEAGVLKVGCVNNGRFRQEENKRLPSELGLDPELTVKAGDLLVSRANTRDLVGSAATPTVDYPNLMISDKLFRLTLDQDSAIPFFFASFLNTPFARRKIEPEATGTSSSMLNIGQSTIREMHVPCPPIEEQLSIRDEVTNRTWDLMALTERALRLVDLLHERRSALISAAVTGKIDVRDWQPQSSESFPDAFVGEGATA